MEQQELFLRVVEILNTLKIPYMVTGSFAVNFYGIPRTTHGIDVVVQILLPMRIVSPPVSLPISTPTRK